MSISPMVIFIAFSVILPDVNAEDWSPLDLAFGGQELNDYACTAAPGTVGQEIFSSGSSSITFANCLDLCRDQEAAYLPGTGQLGCCEFFGTSCKVYSDATFTYDPSLSLTSVGIVASGEREPVCPALMQTWTVSTSVTCPPDRTTQMGKGKGKGKGREECPNDPAALRGDAEITLKHNFVASAVGDATSTNEYCPRLVDTESSSATSSTGVAGSDDGNTIVTVMFPAGAPIDLNNAARCAENDASTQASFTVDWCGCTMVITKEDVTSSAAAGSTRGKGMSTQCAFQYRGQSRATSRAASAKRVVAGASFATTATTTTTTVVVVAVAVVVLVAGAMMLVQRRIRARNAATMANAQVEDTEVVAAAGSSDTMSNSSDIAATTTSDAFEEDAQLY